MRSSAAAAAARSCSTCCFALRDGNPCGALLTHPFPVLACSVSIDLASVPLPVIGLLKSHFRCRATSFGVQATDYQAPPASDPSSSGQGVAQQADGSRRTTERAMLLPKVRIPCLQALKPLDCAQHGQAPRSCCMV